MARLLLLALIGFAVWLLYKGITKRGSRPASGKDSSASGSRISEDMVACSRCGVNLPKSEAKLVNGAYECADSADCAHRS